MKNWIKKMLAVLAVLVGLSLDTYAVPGVIEVAATDAIAAGVTAAEGVLVAAAAVFAAFLLFKLVKRAINKA
jgi:hypothetical protein